MLVVIAMLLAFGFAGALAFSWYIRSEVVRQMSQRNLTRPFSTTARTRRSAS